MCSKTTARREVARQRTLRRSAVTAGASILLVNRNFGCGSSREHAPQAIVRWGIRAVVGESFSDIFFGNALTMGLPCLTAQADAIAHLMTAVERNPRLEMALDLETQTITAAIACFAGMPADAQRALLTGEWDGTGLLLENFGEVRNVASRLPYVAGF